jgi:TPR repeat protein
MGMPSSPHHRILRFFRSVAFMASLPIICLGQTCSAPSQYPKYANLDLLSLAQGRDATAQYLLATKILAHEPSPDEIQSGLKWLRASADQNEPEAQFYLGYLYEKGKFVPQDYALAFQNYCAAALLHYGPAENNLASLYQHGQGVPRNSTQAFQWYLAAAQDGDPTGQINLATLYYRGEGISQDYAETIRWLRTSADAGCSHAQNNLAYFYFYGVVVQRDYVEAARLLQLAAQQNLVRAQTNLANLYSHGQGVSLDYVAAFVWYSRAVAGGDKSAARSRENLARVMTKKQLDQAKAYLMSSPPGMTIEAAKPSIPPASLLDLD